MKLIKMIFLWSLFQCNNSVSLLYSLPHLNPNVSSSEAVQAFLSGSRVVKAINHVGYHDLYDEALPASAPHRKAIAVAGDRAADIAKVGKFIDAIGFTPLPIGPLATGKMLEPGGKAFGVATETDKLAKILSLD